MDRAKKADPKKTAVNQAICDLLSGGVLGGLFGWMYFKDSH